MKIAQVMAGAPAGGAELFYERLTIALAAAGDTVLPVIRRDPARADRLRAAGLTPVELRFGSRLDLLTGPRLRRALRDFAPDVTISWMSRAASVSPRGDWVLVGRLGGFYDLKYFRHCDHLVGNTRAVVDWIIAQGWPADRTHCVPNFVPDMARPSPRREGDDTRPPTLLALGRLHRNKAYDILIRALGRLPGVHAVIAGEGPERDALLALARAEGVADRLSLPGWQADTAALLAACDVLVCPSRVEALGNVVIEGWSARRPVVAAAAQGPAELIQHGESGLLVPVDDPAALADAIRAALDEPLRSSLAATGRLRYEATFTEAAVVERWRRFLRGVEKA